MLQSGRGNQNIRITDECSPLRKVSVNHGRAYNNAIRKRENGADATQSLKGGHLSGGPLGVQTAKDFIACDDGKRQAVMDRQICSRPRQRSRVLAHHCRENIGIQ